MGAVAARPWFPSFDSFQTATLWELISLAQREKKGEKEEEMPNGLDSDDKRLTPTSSSFSRRSEINELGLYLQTWNPVAEQFC